jgi:probable F420-dependent oxidoreductase
MDSRCRRAGIRCGGSPACRNQTHRDRHESYAALTAEHGNSFLLGIGVSHAPLIDADQPGRYRKPLAATVSFLDAPDAAQRPVPAECRVLAALGAKMLALSASRARGAHPYIVTPEHTASARAALGEGPLLLPEQTVILCDTAEEARSIGTDWLRAYLAMPTTPITCCAAGSPTMIWHR